MKHAASRELYAYWQEKRGTRPAPERTEIEPGAIRGVLADAFILALDRGSGHPIRLAGTRLCALFGQSAHHGRSAVDPVRLVHRHGRRRYRPERKRRVGRARTVAAPAQHSPADFRARHRRAGAA
jgi:hypothetical protein